MNPEIKAKWIARLRSGEVKQNKYSLGCTNGKRCCLGILCDIAVEEGIISEPTTRGTRSLVYVDSSGYLPPEVWQWAELPGRDPRPTDCSGMSLSDMNDGGFSFNQIADAIGRGL